MVDKTDSKEKDWKAQLISSYKGKTARNPADWLRKLTRES